MIKRLFIFSVAAVTFNMAFAITPSKLVIEDNGPKIKFATRTIGGIAVFSQEEFDGVIALRTKRGMDTTVEYFTPTELEKSLAGSGIKFTNYSDFVQCVENREYLDDKLLDLKPSEYRKNKAKIDALKLENSKRN